jgi:hypothetical protein
MVGMSSSDVDVVMAFSKSKIAQREHLHLAQVQVCRKFSNGANKPMTIREIRPFVLFAFQNRQSVERS